MKPKNIFLVRHGQSVGNADRSVYSHTPDYKVPITELGLTQSLMAGNSLRTSLYTEGRSILKKLFNSPPSYGVYLSPYMRTRQTWEHIFQSLNLEPKFIKEDPRLREQEWGNLRASREDIEEERESFGSFYYRMLNGESGADVYDRCTGFLDTLYRDFDEITYPDNIIIIGHGFQLRVLLKRWLHLTHEQFEEMKNPKNCEIFQLILGKNGKFKPKMKIPVKSQKFELSGSVTSF